ncbi:hypothetical protein RD792_015673 [Penstemon davidsonii]|uniref:Small ribosomal subunit protein uS15 N-terminal domain-containing protein n=1 Tax=Penstemon davidsonii TaxID=160366 RepID=A0ABR0CHB9_9LAMI|nr:hypothetical protein RD792_015673 [Penstemon davidsonii]
MFIGKMLLVTSLEETGKVYVLEMDVFRGLMGACSALTLLAEAEAEAAAMGRMHSRGSVMQKGYFSISYSIQEDGSRPLIRIPPCGVESRFKRATWLRLAGPFFPLRGVTAVEGWPVSYPHLEQHLHIHKRECAHTHPCDKLKVEDNICKFAKKGLTPSQIGVILRDSHGIAQVKSVTGSKILRILKAHGIVLSYADLLPEDLYHLIKKAVAIRKHLERNRKDKDSKFRLILVESRIHRLARYYKKTKKLPPVWK